MFPHSERTSIIIALLRVRVRIHKYVHTAQRMIAFL